MPHGAYFLHKFIKIQFIIIEFVRFVLALSMFQN